MRTKSCIGIVIAITAAALFSTVVILLRVFYSGEIAPEGFINRVIVPDDMRNVADGFPLAVNRSFYVAGDFEGYYELFYLLDEKRDVEVKDLIERFASDRSLQYIEMTSWSEGWRKTYSSNKMFLTFIKHRPNELVLRVQYNLIASGDAQPTRSEWQK